MSILCVRRKKPWKCKALCIFWSCERKSTFTFQFPMFLDSALSRALGMSLGTKEVRHTCAPSHVLLAPLSLVQIARDPASSVAAALEQCNVYIATLENGIAHLPLWSTVYRHSLLENTVLVSQRNILISNLAKIGTWRGVLWSVKILTF